jgi:mannose-6-phosphate isomerase-like protein (cupin superfamily)
MTTQDGFISGAVAEIKGRYPAHGFVINKKIKELVYVLSGKGQIILSQGETEISVGDVIFVDHMEKFAWNGDMVLFMATAPSFDPKQHIEVE